MICESKGEASLSFDSILVRLKGFYQVLCEVDVSRFDSILVRLKAGLHEDLQTVEYLVSIPYWFD